MHAIFQFIATATTFTVSILSVCNFKVHNKKIAQDDVKTSKYVEVLKKQRIFLNISCICWTNVIKKINLIQGVPGRMCQTSGGCSLC